MYEYLKNREWWNVLAEKGCDGALCGVSIVDELAYRMQVVELWEQARDASIERNVIAMLCGMQQNPTLALRRGIVMANAPSMLNALVNVLNDPNMDALSDATRHEISSVLRKVADECWIKE